MSAVQSEPYDLRFAQPGALGVFACRPAALMALPSESQPAAGVRVN
jgi:hypothetical protein